VPVPRFLPTWKVSCLEKCGGGDGAAAGTEGNRREGARMCVVWVLLPDGPACKLLGVAGCLSPPIIVVVQLGSPLGARGERGITDRKALSHGKNGQHYGYLHRIVFVPLRSVPFRAWVPTVSFVEFRLAGHRAVRGLLLTFFVGHLLRRGREPRSGFGTR
jgi:hypothetical protein